MASQGINQVTDIRIKATVERARAHHERLRELGRFGYEDEQLRTREQLKACPQGYTYLKMPYPGDVDVETAREARHAAINAAVRRQEQSKLDREATSNAPGVAEGEQDIMDLDIEAPGLAQGARGPVEAGVEEYEEDEDEEVSYLGDEAFWKTDNRSDLRRPKHTRIAKPTEQSRDTNMADKLTYKALARQADEKYPYPTAQIISIKGIKAGIRKVVAHDTRSPYDLSQPEFNRPASAPTHQLAVSTNTAAPARELTVSPQGTARVARLPGATTAAAHRTANPTATALGTATAGLGRTLLGPRAMMQDPDFREFAGLASRIKKGDTRGPEAFPVPRGQGEGVDAEGMAEGWGGEGDV